MISVITALAAANRRLKQCLIPDAMNAAESLNQFISLFKATTIVSLIAVPDLMYQVSMITQQEMRPLPLYTGAALVYFAVIFAAGTLLRALSERWRRKIYA